MSEGDPEKPNPIDDLRKGFGLLFRAAKTTLEKLPTDQIEEAVLTGAKEVGRALENVQHSVEEQFLGKSPGKKEEPSSTAEPAKDEAGAAPKAEAPPSEGEAKDETKTRIG
jgi:hypothetical protein